MASKDKNSEYPDEGEIVFGTVKNITQHGAFISLEQYPKHDGMLHISEISSKWVKEVRNHVEKGQKVVVKVLKVNKNKGHIDLSLKDLKSAQRKRKLEEYKKEKRATKLIEHVGEKLDEPEKAGKITEQIEEDFGSLYDPLEEASKKGEEALSNSKVPDKWRKKLAEVAQEQIEIPTVTIKAELEVESSEPNGIDLIKDALKEGRKEAESDEIDVEVKYLAAPKYSVNITAPDYKVAEKALDSLNKNVKEKLASDKGSVKVLR